MANEKQEKKKKKRRPYTTPTITVITYNPRDKVLAITGCDTGSGTQDISICQGLLECEQF